MIRHSDTTLSVNLYELLLIMEEHYLLGRTETKLSIEAMLDAPLEPTLQDEEQAIQRQDTLGEIFARLTQDQNKRVQDPWMPLDMEELIHLYEQLVYGEDLAPLKDEVYRRWKEVEAAPSESVGNSDSASTSNPGNTSDSADPSKTSAPVTFPEYFVTEQQIAVLSEFYLYMGIAEGFQFDGRRPGDMPPPEFVDMGLRLHQMEDAMHYLHLYEKTLHQVKGRNVRYDDINEKFEFVWTEDGVEVVEK